MPYIMKVKTDFDFSVVLGDKHYFGDVILYLPNKEEVISSLRKLVFSYRTVDIKIDIFRNIIDENALNIFIITDFLYVNYSNYNLSVEPIDNL